MSETGGGDGSIRDKIRSHFFKCTKCEEGAKVCPCRDRREFMKKTAGAAGVVAALGNRELIETVEATQQGEAADAGSTGAAGLSTDEVFPQSVASGGPTEDGVILWTRVSDRAIGEAPDADLQLTVADDPNFDVVVYEGTVEHDGVTGNDNCVRCDLAGELDANEEYFYHFDYGGVSSNTGRCRTLPGADGSVEELTFAVVNCNHYQNGYFHAYGYAAEHAADFMLHLGDFIYESTGGVFTSDQVIEPNADGYYSDVSSPVRDLPDEYKDEFRGVPERLTNGNGDRHEKLAWHADDYRALYKAYKSRENTKRALEQHTMIYTWDDHEVADDRYWDYDASGPESDGVGGAFVTSERYANAIQAWLEHIPARVEADREKIQTAANGEDIYEYTTYGRQFETNLHSVFDLYDHIEFGDLLELFVTDERFYREQPPSGRGPTRTLKPVKDNNGFVDPLNTTLENTRNGNEETYEETHDHGRHDHDPHEHEHPYEFESEEGPNEGDPHHADRTMLGGQQKRWMEDRLRDSNTTWTLWMNEVLASPMTISEPGSLLAKHLGGLGFLPGPDDHPEAVEIYHDAWDGYISEREDILGAAREGTNNFVTLTGDMHASLASRLLTDYGGGDTAGVEFMVPAMTSETPYEQMSEGGVPDVPKKPPVLTSDDSVDRLQTALTMMNTHVKDVDFRTTGYAVVTVTENHLDYKTFDVVRSLESGGVDGRAPAMHKRKPNNDNLWWERARVDETQATAAVTLSDQKVSVGESVEFDASSSAADFGSTRGRVTKQHEWDFGDGTTETGGQQVQHSFDEPGAYEVELTLDARLTGRGAGRTDSDTASVRVLVTEDNESPVAEIGVSNYDGPDDRIVVGDAVRFSSGPSEDPDGHFVTEVDHIEWDLGDGTTETGEPSSRGNPGATGVTHTFDEPGNYTVELTLTDRHGARDTARETITVERDRVVAAFDYESLDGESDVILVDQAVAFDAEVDANGEDATYEWAFGDGTTASGASVEHFFESGGTFEIELTVTGPDGDTATQTERVTVDNQGPEDVPGDADFTGQADFGDLWTTTYTVEATSSALELRMEGPPGSDFDLLATRDGSTPENVTEYDYASRTIFPAETVRIDDQFEPGDSIGIGVFAAFGTGQFALSVTEVTPEQDRKNGKKGETAPETPGDGEGEDGENEGDGEGGSWFDDLIDDAFGGWDDSDETGSESDTGETTGDDGTGGDGDETGGGWFGDDGDGLLPGDDGLIDWGDDDDDTSDDNDGTDDGGDDDGWFGWGGDDSSDDDGSSDTDSSDDSGSDDGGWFDWGGDDTDDDSSDDSSSDDDGGDANDDGSSDDGGSDDGGSDDGGWDPVGGWENNYDQTGDYGGSGGDSGSDDNDDDSDDGDDDSGGGLLGGIEDTVDEVTDTIGGFF